MNGLVMVGDVCVQLIEEGDVIARMMRNGKAWEPETRAAWASLLCAGEMVLDIGAYTGVYSIASALMGAKVMAFEPHPANYLRLMANAAINSVHIDVLPIAASHEDRLALLHTKGVSGVLSDTASLEMEHNHTVTVVCKRIDWLRFATRVALIKIDAEHHELSTLIGAMHTITTHKPNVIVETLSSAASKAVEGVMSFVKYERKNVFDQRNSLWCPT